jgi:hypothetical protein
LHTGPAPALALRLESTAPSNPDATYPVFTVNPPPATPASGGRGGASDPAGPFSSGGPASGMIGTVTPVLASTNSPYSSGSAAPLVVLNATSDARGGAGASSMLVALGYSPVGGVSGPSDTPGVTLPIAQTLVTALDTTFIGMTVTTISPGWEALPDELPPPAQEPATGSAAKDEAIAIVGIAAPGLMSAAGEVAAMVPDILQHLVLKGLEPLQPLTTADRADEAPPVVHAGFLAPGEDAAAVWDWTRAWPVALGGLGAASVLYARSRTSRGRDEKDETKPRRGVHWLARGSSLRAALRTMPRFPFGLLHVGPPEAPTVPDPRGDEADDRTATSTAKRPSGKVATHRSRTREDATARLVR